MLILFVPSTVYNFI